jgi:hypothetical protein
MGTRKQRQRQEELWYRQDLAEVPGHLQVPANAVFFFALCALATSLPSRSEPSMLDFVTEPIRKVS